MLFWPPCWHWGEQFLSFFYSNNSNHLSQSREKVWTLSFLCLIISLFHAFFIVPKKGDSSCLSSADVSQLQPSVSIKGKGLELCLFCAIIIFSLFYASLFQKGDVQLFISRQPTSAQNKKEFCRRQLFFSFYFYLCPSPHSVPPTHKHPTSP